MARDSTYEEPAAQCLCPDDGEGALIRAGEERDDPYPCEAAKEGRAGELGERVKVQEGELAWVAGRPRKVERLRVRVQELLQMRRHGSLGSRRCGKGEGCSSSRPC